MKRVICLLFLSASLVSAQDFVAPKPRQVDIVPDQVIERNDRPSIEGIVKEIFVTKKPWQLVNPTAPKEYGSGEKMVSKDFGPGTPVKSTGLIVASVEF